jgi:hypothetical protein
MVVHSPRGGAHERKFSHTTPESVTLTNPPPHDSAYVHCLRTLYASSERASKAWISVYMCPFSPVPRKPLRLASFAPLLARPALGIVGVCVLGLVGPRHMLSTGGE